MRISLTSRSLTAILTASHGIIGALAFRPGAGAPALVSGDGGNGAVTWDLNPVAVASTDCRMLAAYPGLSQAELLVPGVTYAGACAAYRAP